MTSRAAIFVLALAATASAAVPEKVRFNRDVRPILSNNCFYCHGPDEKKREAKLRLDLRESALAEHDSGRAIVPGKPDESEMLTRIVSHDKDEMMPPPKAKKPPLTEEQIATLRRWIEQGADYEGHWAFQPLNEAAPPSVRDTRWVRNPIDAFILENLEREGVKPSPEADRATLIRRVSLDLIGLPPTPEEVQTVIADSAPDAYEKLVDRLLANPHFGERWGRHWLDQARYADSNGYSVDSARAMWPFRDWVIKACNDDLPFDRFTIEQLAGDLLPNATKSQFVATAFHRNTLINEEGGVKPEQFRVESVIDRVNTTGAVWLGLTIGCAQCHTHKFDPIPHREFYQMFAFFNQGEDANNKGATVSVAKGEIFGKTTATLAPANAAPAKSAPLPTGATWSPAQYVEFDTASNAGLRRLDDNSILADGGGSFNDSYRIVAKTSLPKVAAVRLRVITDDSLPHRGPGMANNGNFVLTEITASVDGVDQPFVRAFADHEQPDYPVAAAIDHQPKTGWAINVGKGSTAKMNADHEAVFVLEKPLNLAGKTIELRLLHELNQKYLIGRFAIEFTSSVPGTPDAPVTSTKKDAPRTDVADVMVMKDLAAPRPTFLLQRGDYTRPDEAGGPLQPAVLTAVAPALPAAQGRTRLDLAKWLVDPANPLTPRVTMNRVWMRYFGRGIVDTDEDFGTQGAAPAHPELLDWLGREFIRRGWSMKAMHRLIVTSATYRQSSKARPDLAERDPRNLWLARQERVRVEAEIVRDAALSASGLIDLTIGGPSVHPPQPEGVYAFTQTGKKWEADKGPDRFRRALYTMFFRSAPYPLFATFDVPDLSTVCTRRTRSNTPLQALNVANDPAFLELAAGLAARVQREIPAADSEARLRRAFALCMSRAPSEKELTILRDFARDNDLAAVARVLFNTDNFITRE